MRSELFDLHAEIELVHWWFVGRRRIMQELLHAVLPSDPNKQVVDIGCGTGANIAALFDDYTVLGIDTSSKAIKYARKRFPNTRFICGFAPKDLGNLAGGTDAYLLMDVLEHVEDATAVLAPLVDTLKPGGIVLITVPADMRLWSEHDINFGHYRRYDLPSFRSIWSDLPVTELVASYFNSRLYPVARVARTISRMRARAWGKAGSDLSVPAAPVNSFLENIFAGESKRLLSVMEGQRSGYYAGVSLIAVLERQG